MLSYKYKFSVIIPHYKDLDCLHKLIESIPHRDDTQIIIVDDNSFPGTETVENEIAIIGRDIQLFFNEKDSRGAGACRNIGIDRAEGEWLIFSDADDYFLPEAFDHFDDSSFSHADIVYFKMDSINMPGETKGTRHLQYNRLIDAYIEEPIKTNELNLRYNYPSPCAKMVRRSLIVKNNIQYEEVRWANDDMFATKCGYYAKEIAAKPETVYCVVRKSGTITTATSEEAMKVRIGVYIRKMLFLRDHLSKRDFRKVTRWPGNKLITAVLDGYDSRMLKFIIREFRKNHISLLWINKSDIREIIIKLISQRQDKKYKNGHRG